VDASVTRPAPRARGVEVFARKAFAGDVAIRHHADQPIIFLIGMQPISCPCINFAISVTGVSGLTQSTLHYVPTSWRTSVATRPLSFNYTTDQQRPHGRIDGSRSLRAD
jgi:hypothetical protein